MLQSTKTKEAANIKQRSWRRGGGERRAQCYIFMGFYWLLLAYKIDIKTSRYPQPQNRLKIGWINTWIMSGIWGYFPDRFGPILLSAQNRSQNRQKIALTERVLARSAAIGLRPGLPFLLRSSTCLFWACPPSSPHRPSDCAVCLVIIISDVYHQISPWTCP